MCTDRMWAQLDFFLVKSITLSFQIKKTKFQKFCPHGFLWPQRVEKILKFCSWYRLWHLINFEHNVSDAWFFYPNNSIPSVSYGNNHFHIHLIAINHNGSSKFVKIFIKSISLAILSYHYGFFKEVEIFIFSLSESF